MFTSAKAKFLAALILLWCACLTRSHWLNGVPEPKDLVDQIRNFTDLWREYKQTWTWYHDQIPPEVLGYQNFRCDITNQTPDMEAANVHMLRPQDVGVIAALGDSLTAGSGAAGHKLIDTGLEYRGVSFPVGGDGTLEDTLTLANILRKYNPGLYGASKHVGSVDFEPFSQLNVAIPGARARDMPDQARELIGRLRRNSRFLRMWKVVTIFIGANDLCQYCVEHRNVGQDFVTQWISDIETAINILAQGLPKTFVNLVPAPPVSNLREFDGHPICKVLHAVECPCISLNYKNYTRTDEIIREYQTRLNDITGHNERWDFTVVVQPFSTNILVPINKERNESDLSYLAADCFHFNRRSHAAAAAALWNSMLQPVGEKNTTTDPASSYPECPDPECPYFRTSINSVNCSTDHVIMESRTPLSNFIPICQGYYMPGRSIRVAAANENADAVPPVTGKRGPAMWIFVGLLVALIAGVVVLYCAWIGKGAFRQQGRVPDEYTPLITRSAAA